jgi:membrane protein
VLFVAGQALPFALLCAAFTCLYRFMPNTEVRLSSALVGGMAAALLWHLAGVAFAAFVAGSTRYTAIYSGFAGVMVFLIWLYVGWLIVLGGGQVAYFYQYPASYVAGLTRHGSLFHEWAALAVLADITRRFLARQGPVRVAELAAATSVPVAPLQRIVDDLVSHGILLRAAEPEGVALARPPEMVTVDEALAVVSDPAGRDRDWVERGPAPVGEILRRRDGAVGEALTDLTLRSLVASPPPESSVTDLARYRQR